LVVTDVAGGLVNVPDVGFGSTTVFVAPKSHFRFAPDNGLKSDVAPLPKSANSCREQVQQKSAAEGLIYSITSSAMVRLFSEQAFKNLARPWGQLRGCNCRRRLTTRGGHPIPE
jgi:hypothetical protein